MNTESFSTRVREALWSFRENKKAVIIVLVVVVLLLLVALYLIVSRFVAGSSDAKQSQSLNITTDVNAVTESTRRFIDGVSVSSEDSNLLPVAVMIENFVTVRPQYGLKDAQVVYETLAEGGITRFMAVYATNNPITTIGPVRSARPYFVDWAQEYEGVYAHAGGSPQALSQLSSTSQLTSLNQISGDHAYFERNSSIPAPHNLFTNSTLLAYALRDKELEERSGTFDPWKFEPESDLSERPENASTIHIPFSSSSYNVAYTYDREQNSYKRFFDDNGELTEHRDALSDSQLTVKNIVVQSVSTALDDPQTGRLRMQTIGEGDALIMNNGNVITGTWKKPSADVRTRFYTENNEEVVFVPGTIWIEVLPDDKTVLFDTL